MRRLHLYLTANLATVLGLALGVSTFVLLLGSIGKIMGKLADGLPVGLMLVFVLLKLPQLLSFSVPLSLLVAVVMVYNRMSADNEISALRASGVGLLQITTPALFLSIAVCVLSFLLQFEYGPTLTHQAHAHLHQGVAKTPLALFEARRFNEVRPGVLIYVGQKDDRQVHDVHMYRLDPEGELQEYITANTGSFEVDDTERVITLHLQQVNSVTMHEDTSGTSRDLSRAQRVYAEELRYPIRYGDSYFQSRFRKRPKEMTLRELLAHIALYTDTNIDTTELLLELNLRAVMSLAPFSFVLLGIPLGITMGRKESSAGLVGGVVAGFLYYCTVVLVSTLKSSPELHPEILIWLPNLACQFGGLWLMRGKR